MAFTLESYSAYMKGDDEAVELLNKELVEKLEMESSLLQENLNSLDEEAKQLELELAALKSMPSEWDTIENQRKDLEVELNKLQEANLLTVQEMEDKEKEENEELEKRVEAQGIMSVEKEISEAESSRRSCEEKCRDLDFAIGHKLKELEYLSIECNQAHMRTICEEHANSNCEEIKIHEQVLNLQIQNDTSKDSESKASEMIMKYSHSSTAGQDDASSVSTNANGSTNAKGKGVLKGVVIEDITASQQTTKRTTRQTTKRTTSRPVDLNGDGGMRRSKRNTKVHSLVDEKAQGDKISREIVLSLSFPSPVPKRKIVLAIPNRK